MRLIVAPGTILLWHRDIVRRQRARWSRRGRSGRPAAHHRVRSEVQWLARENEFWGRPPDPGRARRARHHRGGPSTVWQILKDAGIDPALSGDGEPAA